MGSKQGTYYIVMRIQKEISVTVWPTKVSLEDKDHVGMLSVYKTKTAARKVWGKDVELQEVQAVGVVGR